MLDQLETGYFDGGQDTVVDISLRMKGLEPSGYYRLNVRSLTEKVVDGKTVYDTNDCYHSYDPLFRIFGYIIEKALPTRCQEVLSF